MSANRLVMLTALALCLGGLICLPAPGRAEPPADPQALVERAQQLVEQYSHRVPMPLTPAAPGSPPSQFGDMPLPMVRCMPSSYFPTNPPNQQIRPYAWTNRELIVWGRVDGGTPPYTYVWEFGDGSNTSGAVSNPAYIAAVHTYTNSGPKMARLTTTDANNEVASRQVRIDVVVLDAGTERIVRTNAAIEDGLRWLYLHQSPDGGWDGASYAAGAAVAAFELRGHLPGNDPVIDVYAEPVHAGLDFIFGTLCTFDLSEGPPPPGGCDFDLNDNGVGIFSCVTSYGNYTYSHGILMLALAASQDTTGVAGRGPAGVLNESYKKILTDMVDQLSWSQCRSGSQGGGWRYYVNSPFYCEADNSAVQWASIGLDAAEHPNNSFLIAAPPCVKEDLRTWLDYSQCGDGCFGYQSPGWCNTAKTGSGIFSLKFTGYPEEDARVQHALDCLCARWCDSGDSNGYREQLNGNFYAVYAVKKALDDYNIRTLPCGRDWYDDYIHHLVQGYATPCGSNDYHQITDSSPPNLGEDGFWPANQWLAGQVMPTTFALLTLIPGAVACRIVCDNFAVEPEACARPNAPVCFDGREVYTTCSNRRIVSWLWDFDASDGVSFDPPDAVGPYVCKNDGYQLRPGDPDSIFTVTLRVYDDSLGACESGKPVSIRLDCDNNPPVACLNGPFTACVGDSIFLDGCCSRDPDPGDSVVEYRWDLDGNGSTDLISSSCTPDTFLVFNEERIQEVRLVVVDTFGSVSPEAAQAYAWSSLDELTTGPADLVLDPPNSCAGVRICGTFHADLRPDTVLAVVDVVFYLDDPSQPINEIGSFTAQNVVDGDVRTFCFNWENPDSSAHEIYLVIDPRQQVRECNERDNVVHKPLCDSECPRVTPGDADEIQPNRWRLPILALDEAAPPPVYSFQLILRYDPAMLSITGYTLNGTVVEGLPIVYEDFNVLGPGRVAFDVATTQPIPTPGPLVYLLADADGSGRCGDCSDLILETFMYNEDDPCSTVLPGEFCFPANSVAGTVRYFTCDELDPEPDNPRPVPEVTLSVFELCPDDSSTTQVATDSLGAYVFAGACPDCTYDVTPAKPKLLTGAEFINSWDAQQVLAYVVENAPLDLCPVPAQGYDRTGLGEVVYCAPPGDFVAGLVTLPGWPGDPSAYRVLPQRVTAEVSGNNAITAFDASLILRYAVGDSAGLASRAGDWEFLCADKQLVPAADIGGSDYVGFLMGDVSGNWAPATVLREPGPSQFALDTAPGDQRVLVIVRVDGNTDLLAFDAELVVNPDALTLVGARPIGDASEFLVAARAEGDRVRVAAAGVRGLASGEFLELEFANRQGRGLMPEELPALAWTRMNDAGVQWTTTAVPDFAPWWVARAEPALVAIRPNPFNPATEIEYYLPTGSPVRLDVYAVSGHLVRALVDARVETGLHTVVWDGRDARGIAQPSGLYFARLTTPSATRAQKMMLLK